MATIIILTPPTNPSSASPDDIEVQFDGCSAADFDATETADAVADAVHDAIAYGSK